WPNRNRDVGYFYTKDSDVFFLHPETIHILNFLPNFQRHNQIDLFLAANAAHTEHSGDVDDSNATDFHVIASNFCAGANHIPPIDQCYFGNIVGHEAVPAFNQCQHAFTFADATLAPDDHAHPEYIYHTAHLGPARGKHHFERQCGQIDELHRDQRRTEDGNVCVFGGL